MIENIKRIGLFMIVAQTFIHFAAGKQYEKYMKIIAGVIVLLLFVRPFSSPGMDFEVQWQLEMEHLTEQMKEQTGIWEQTMPDMDHGTERRIVGQFEKEIQEKLNREVALENFTITDVKVEWEGGDEKGSVEAWEKTIGGIVITLKQTVQEDQDLEKGNHVDPVTIESIHVETGGRKGGQEWRNNETNPEDSQRKNGGEAKQETDRDMETAEYCRMFAEALGIEETQVEVNYSGGK